MIRCRFFTICALFVCAILTFVPLGVFADSTPVYESGFVSFIKGNVEFVKDALMPASTSTNSASVLPVKFSLININAIRDSSQLAAVGVSSGAYFLWSSLINQTANIFVPLFMQAQNINTVTKKPTGGTLTQILNKPATSTVQNIYQTTNIVQSSGSGKDIQDLKVRVSNLENNIGSGVTTLQPIINNTYVSGGSYSVPSPSSIATYSGPTSFTAGDLQGILSVGQGGTGTSTAPTLGQILLGNNSGGFDLVATSSLGIVGGSSVFALDGSNSIYSSNTVSPGSSDIFAVGESAGDGASNSPYANFIGYFAGNGASNAQKANFIGYEAGNGATGAYNANFIGVNAGYGAISADKSNFIGHRAGEGALYASRSNFLGRYTGFGALYANNSFFVGDSAGYSADTASRSIFLGDYAGYNDTVDNTGNGGTSILIGNHTSTGGYSNSIAIGRGTQNTSVQQLNIGNVLYATGIYNGDTPSGTPTGGSVGIGTDAPATTLHVSGAVNDLLTLQSTIGQGGNTANLNFQTYETQGSLHPTAGISAIDDGNYSSSLAFLTKTPGGEGNALAERMRVSSDGNVGIGTTNPKDKLQIGTQNVIGQPVEGQFSLGRNVYFDGSNWRYIESSTAATIQMEGPNGGTDGSIGFYTLPSGTGGDVATLDPSTQRMTILNSGNVGIGNNAPGRALDIKGSNASIALEDTNSGGLGRFILGNYNVGAADFTML